MKFLQILVMLVLQVTVGLKVFQNKSWEKKNQCGIRLHFGKNNSCTNLLLLFSRSVVSESLRPHGLQHARLPCPSPSPGAYSNSCPLNGWCHLTILSCRPLLLPPSIFPSVRVFSNESGLCIRWPKNWSFSFSSFNEYSGSISFRIDWFDLLAVQGTLKSLLQHHSLKASILRCSGFFMVPLSHPHMTTGKTIALTRQTFVSTVTSLLFNMLSRFVVVFLYMEKNLEGYTLRS